jgi:hypothetical protein
MDSKRKIIGMIIDADEFLDTLAYGTGTEYIDLGTDKEHNNLWARNASKAVISWRNHLLNRLEDIDEK